MVFVSRKVSLREVLREELLDMASEEKLKGNPTPSFTVGRALFDSLDEKDKEDRLFLSQSVLKQEKIKRPRKPIKKKKKKKIVALTLRKKHKPKKRKRGK